MPPLLLSSLPAITALIIYFERMRELATKRDVIDGKREETLTLKLFILCGALTIGGGLAEHFLLQRGLWWPAYIGGIVLAVFTFVFRRRAIAALGRFWSLHVEMRDGHEFVQSGPFAKVRHPAYFSMILEHVAIALVLGSWFTLGLVMLIFLPTLNQRIRIEEKALIAKFGTAYEEYCKKVPALIPRP